MDTLLAHAESTSSTFNYILLSLLGLSSSEIYSHAASHLGIAQTVATLLRALPYHASKGTMVIPASITAKHRVNQEDVFRKGPAAEGLTDAVYEFAVVANDHLLTAREMFKKDGVCRVPREAMPVFLNAVSCLLTSSQLKLMMIFGKIPVENYLRKLEKANFEVFDPKLQLRDGVRLPWQIWRSHYSSTF